MAIASVMMVFLRFQPVSRWNGIDATVWRRVSQAVCVATKNARIVMIRAFSP
jgi:hypothetical protein